MHYHDHDRCKRDHDPGDGLVAGEILLLIFLFIGALPALLCLPTLFFP